MPKTAFWVKSVQTMQLTSLAKKRVWLQISEMNTRRSLKLRFNPVCVKTGFCQILRVRFQKMRFLAPDICL